MKKSTCPLLLERIGRVKNDTKEQERESMKIKTQALEPILTQSWTSFMTLHKPFNSFLASFSYL